MSDRLEEIRQRVRARAYTNADVDELLEQIDSLQKDSRRLEWLVMNSSDGGIEDGWALLQKVSGEWEVVDCHGQSWEHKTLGRSVDYREAIDSAIESGS